MDVINHKEIKTNWYVITGGPCTGKTTVVELLAKRGYMTIAEQARHYIDTQKIEGRTVEEIRSNREQFQLEILNLQIREESTLDVNKIAFLDRALPDAMAYYEFLGLKYDDRLIAMCKKFCYQKVFVLDRLPLINDYARLEDEQEQIRIHNLIIEVYNHFPCPVIQVPVLPPDQRVDFILQHL
jgi:predicted ATPase